MNLILKYKNVAIIAEEGISFVGTWKIKSLNRIGDLSVRIIHLRDEKHYSLLISVHPYAQYIKMDLYNELYVGGVAWRNIPKWIRIAIMEDTSVRILMRDDRIDSILK